MSEQQPILESSAVARRSIGNSVSAAVWSSLKKIAAVGLVYAVGYMNWSVAWLIGPVVLTVVREQWKREKDLKRNIAKAAALASEKEVILARIDDLPAWVFFPDVDRAEWFNRILRQMWPNVNHYARDLIKDVIEPNIASVLTSYKLRGFKFDRMILGTIPPRIGGIKVYDKHVSRDEIIMDIDIFYAGDCDISFHLNGVKGGIKDFQIHGMVRIIMKPLMSIMPLVGGLQIFFLNNPTIDFDLVGVVDVLDMPGLSDMLRRIIVEQVAAMMVLPNKLSISLSDVVDPYTLKMPEPQGVLRMHIVEARRLMKKDIGMLGKGKSDPYAVIKIGAQTFRTKAIDNTINPKWDHWCECTVLIASSQSVFLHVWDKDEGPLDDESLGRATIELDRVVKAGDLDMWIPLEQAKHGDVHIRLKWLTLSENFEDLKEALRETEELHLPSLSTAVLTVFVDSAKGLPQAREKSKPDAYATLTLGSTTHTTSVQMRTDAPVWEQGYTFLVPNPHADTLYVKVEDQKTGSTIGEFSYSLSNLSTKENMYVDKQPFALEKAGPESKILLSMNMRILKSKCGSGSGEMGSNQSLEVNPFDASVPYDHASLVRGDSTISRCSVKPCVYTQKHPPRVFEWTLARQVQIGRNRGVVTVPPTPHKGPSKEVRKQDSVQSAPGQIRSHPEMTELDDSVNIEDIITAENVHPVSSSTNSSPVLRHRISQSAEVGADGLGRIQLTLRYSSLRQKLIVVVHKVARLPMKDPSNIPDPYVKLYLLPDRAKETKRKTAVIKDNCNPVFDETFEYILSEQELKSQNLEVTVVTQKSIFSSGNNILGQVIIDLAKSDISQTYTSWFDLHPEYTD